jgi:hypothetical protein
MPVTQAVACCSSDADCGLNSRTLRLYLRGQAGRRDSEPGPGLCSAGPAASSVRRCPPGAPARRCGQVRAAVALDHVAPKGVQAEHADHQLRPAEGVGALEGHVQRQVPHQRAVRPCSGGMLRLLLAGYCDPGKHACTTQRWALAARGQAGRPGAARTLALPRHLRYSGLDAVQHLPVLAGHHLELAVGVVAVGHLRRRTLRPQPRPAAADRQLGRTLRTSADSIWPVAITVKELGASMAPSRTTPATGPRVVAGTCEQA